MREVKKKNNTVRIYCLFFHKVNKKKMINRRIELSVRPKVRKMLGSKQLIDYKNYKIAEERKEVKSEMAVMKSYNNGLDQRLS